MKSIVLAACVLLLAAAACGEPAALPAAETPALASATPAPRPSASPAASAAPSAAPSATPSPSAAPSAAPSASPTSAPSATPTPSSTATPNRTIFDPAAFGDSRTLDSFSMQVNSQASGSGAGQLESYSKAFEYNRSPLSLHEKLQDVNGPHEFWVLDPWAYWFSSFWYAAPFHPATDMGENTSYADLDMRLTTYLVKVISAKFAGQESYQGLPVYRFTFDTSNLAESRAAWKVEAAQGEVLVSVDANIPLYYQVTVRGSILANASGPNYLPGQVTLTKALSQINQPLKIALPANYPNLATEPGFPLPPGVNLQYLNRVNGVTQYLYATQVSGADFSAYYAGLASVNGWSVAKTGPLQGNSYTCSVCVILSNGKEQVRVVWESEFNRTVIWVFNPPELY